LDVGLLWILDLLMEANLRILLACLSLACERNRQVLSALRLIDDGGSIMAAGKSVLEKQRKSAQTRN
jgi:hypothetical protein